MNVKEHLKLVQVFLSLQDVDKDPYVINGRKFDRIFLDDKVVYFIARMNVPAKGIQQGDIYKARSVLAPNLNWYFGNLVNCQKWNWKDGDQPSNVSDDSVVKAGAYKNYVHWIRK